MKKFILLICLLCLPLCACRKEPETVEVLVYIEETLTLAEAQSIATQFQRIDGVISATFVSAEQALEDFLGDREKDDVFDSIEASYLRHRFFLVVETDAVDAVVEQLQQIDGVADVK